MILYLRITLLIVWGGLLFGGFIFGKPDRENEHRIPTWARMGSSLTLVLAGWAGFLFSAEGPTKTFVFFLAIGMTLGAVGDFSMAKLLPLPDHVIGGIAAFGLGHMAYIYGILQYANTTGRDTAGTRWVAWAVWLVIGLAGWYVVVFRGGKPTVLHWVALPYALLLASTAGFATSLALQASEFWGLAGGATLFLISDLILAAQLFNNLKFNLIGDVVWLTYGPGQMLIVYCIGFGGGV